MVSKEDIVELRRQFCNAPVKPSRMSFEECKLKMLEAVKLLGNNQCADCSDDDPQPDFLSLKLGVFICIKCSGIHRSLGPQCSNAKSIKLDTMNRDMVNEMLKMGNLHAKNKYQRNVPECWPIVKRDDPPDLIEQWIRAKYEREEFTEGDVSSKQPYSTGSKYGWLVKREKSSNKWNKRYFILSTQQGYLCYFVKQEDSEPKARIHISHVNLMLIPEDFTSQKHSLLLVFPVSHGGYARQRHIFVSSSSSFEIIDWFLAIRAARLHFLRPYLYGVEKPVVDHLLSRPYVKMGYLYKTGSKNGDTWRKRFICLDTHKFLYFKEPTETWKSSKDLTRAIIETKMKLNTKH